MTRQDRCWDYAPQWQATSSSHMPQQGPWDAPQQQDTSHMPQQSPREPIRFRHHNGPGSRGAAPGPQLMMNNDTADEHRGSVGNRPGAW